jgi:ABC-2 type transport system ATP-binding protein
MSTNVIQVLGLEKRFGEVLAVTGLAFSVRKGEMFALVGPDGAGKTTTIRMLCGVVTPTAGTARVLGFDISQSARDVHQRIGYLSQRFSLYGDLSIDENIEFFAEIHGLKDFSGRRDDLLEFTKLAPFRDRLADRLSGGMKQKLALACTLVHTPEILFLDEPTTGVDPVSRREFWKLLHRLLADGLTIVMTTPYLDEAERCSRVLMMNKGQVMDIDTPLGLLRHARGKVLEVICHPTRVAFDRLKTEFEEVQAFGDRLNLLVQDIESDRSKAESILRSSGVVIETIRSVPPSLENVFISLLSHSNIQEV